MINLLKADLFRLRKSKTFKISMLIMLLLVVGFSFLYFMEEDFLVINGTFRDNRMYGFYIGQVRENRSYLNFFRSSLGLTIFTCLTMLFIITDFTISKYSNGILKNTVSYGHNKYKIYLSNMISIYIGVCIIALSYIVLSMAIISFLFFPGYIISKDELCIMLKVTITLLIILASMVSFYTLIATIVKSKALVATLGALFIILISALLFDVVDANIKNKIPIYMITNLCGQPTDISLLNSFIMNSGVLLVVSLIVGCVIFKKQEIK